MTANEIQITLSFGAEIAQDPETGLFCSHAPNLKLYSQGQTEEDARLGLMDAVQLYLFEHLRRGSLDSEMRRLGFSPVRGPVSLESNDFLAVAQPRETLQVPLLLQVPPPGDSPVVLRGHAAA